MKRFPAYALITAFFLFILAAHSYALPLPESIDHAVRQVQDIASTIKEFSATLYSVVSFVTRLLGFSAVLLFFASLITSAGLVSVGVPAGSISFLAALAFWDILWLLWTSSAGKLNLLFAPVFLEVNLKVCSPFILFEFIRFGVPYIYMLILRLTGKGFSRTQLSDAAGGIALASARLQASLTSDLASRSQRIVLSGESRAAAAELKKACDKILSGPDDSDISSAVEEVHDAGTDT